jgi:hypothetical protein
MDKSITQDIRLSGAYHVISEAPYWDRFGTGQFTIWAYQRPPQPAGHLLNAPRGGRRGYR